MVNRIGRTWCPLVDLNLWKWYHSLPTFWKVTNKKVSFFLGLYLTLLFVLLSYIFLNLAFLSLNHNWVSVQLLLEKFVLQNNILMQLPIKWHLLLTIMAQCVKIIRHLQYEVEIYRVLKKSTFKNLKFLSSNFCFDFSRTVLDNWFSSLILGLYRKITKFWSLILVFLILFIAPIRLFTTNFYK